MARDVRFSPPSEAIAATTLANGIRVLTERISHVRTVAIGIWVGTGSRNEPPEQHGISHFLEHLFFKGTATRSALEIAQAVDDIGGEMNAFTDPEQTGFFVKGVSFPPDPAVEVYADNLLPPPLAAERLQRERPGLAAGKQSYAESPE